MDLMKIFQALENLIFEIFASLAFWPKTLWMVIRHPLKTVRIMDEELDRKQEFRFNKIMSPVFFALLPMIALCYIFQLICAEFSPMDIINDWSRKTEVMWVTEEEPHSTNKSMYAQPVVPGGTYKLSQEFFRQDTAVTATAIVKQKTPATYNPLSAEGKKVLPIATGKFVTVQKTYQIENKDLYPLVTGLLFLTGPFFLAILLILLLKEPLTKENLQKKFLHQCLIGTPLNVFFYFPISAMSGGSAIFPILPDYVKIPMLILLVPSLLWYWIAEVWYIRYYLGKSGMFGAALTFSFYILNIFAFGFVGILLAFLM